MNKITYSLNTYSHWPAHAELSAFHSPLGTTAVWHLMAHVDDPALTFVEQVQALAGIVRHSMAGLDGCRAVFARLFLSDAANQQAVAAEALGQVLDGAALSVVQQPPLDGTKLAVWVWLEGGVLVNRLNNGGCEAFRGDCRHVWMGGWTRQGKDSEQQTTAQLTDYARLLRGEDCTLLDNCVRTWFFVQNIDRNYAGLVKARNEVFKTEGLTPETHFISSTGIEGRGVEADTLVLMDAYAVDGLKAGQMSYLTVPEYMNPTYEYGVSFERGTMVRYPDRREVYVSGTASIDRYGQVVHVGDIRRQTERMVQNVQALLAEAGCSLHDVAQAIVYLRDSADYAVVRGLIDHYMPHVPRVLVHAPVCRPEWLIEMECIAIRKEVAD